MQRKENSAAEDQGQTLDHKPDRHPTDARDHHYQKAVLILTAYQVNAGQSGNGRKPINPEILHSTL